MPQPKRQRSGESDVSTDEMDHFSQQSFTQQRQLIFEKLLSIENVNKDKINNLVKDVESLKTKVEVLEKENTHLKNIINNVDQSNISDSVVLYGIPIKKDVSDVTVVKNIGEKLNIPVTESDISDLFRLGPKEETNEENSEEPKCVPLVVKFTRQTMKDKFMNQRRKKNLKATDVGYKDCKTPVYINEFLTKTNLKLLKYAKKLKEYDIKYVWPSRGKIMVTTECGGRFSIDDIEHVDRLIKIREESRGRRSSNT